MKTYRKINIYFMGDYWASTNQSKTCREAIQKLIELIEQRGLHKGELIQAKLYQSMLDNKKELIARFSK